jgi:DNA-binding NarL/FixJ family response regulator
MDRTPQILLIDDNVAWLEALAEFLRRRGLVSTTSHDPVAGLALLEERPAPVVVVDLHMPGMDGLEFLRRLRKVQRRVSVLVVSSDDAPETVARLLAEGASAVVPKDVAPALIVRAVQRALNAHVEPHFAPCVYHLLPFHAPQGLLSFQQS